MPGIEINLSHAGTPHGFRFRPLLLLLVMTRNFIHILAQLPHEERLARAPVTEQTKRKRWLDLFEGKHVGDIRHLTIDIQQILQLLTGDIGDVTSDRRKIGGWSFLTWSGSGPRDRDARLLFLFCQIGGN